MASRPSQTPVRIPPPRPTRDRSAADQPPGSSAAPIAAGADTLAKDAAALQAQLDNLVAHFEQLRAQLRQAQKLASIGTTAAMIAHEFNNLFTPVVAYARQALDTDNVDLMRIALNKTLERTATMRDMADRIIGLAKQSDDAVRPLKLRETVENAVGCLCRDLDKDKITLNVQIDRPH